MLQLPSFNTALTAQRSRFCQLLMCDERRGPAHTQLHTAAPSERSAVLVSGVSMCRMCSEKDPVKKEKKKVLEETCMHACE